MHRVNVAMQPASCRSSMPALLLARKGDGEVAAPVLRQEVLMKSVRRGAEDALPRPHHVPDPADRKALHLERVKKAELKLQAHGIGGKDRDAKTLGDGALEGAVAGKLHRGTWLDPMLEEDRLRRFARARPEFAQQKGARQQIGRLQRLPLHEGMLGGGEARELVV